MLSLTYNIMALFRKFPSYKTTLVYGGGTHYYLLFGDYDFVLFSQ